MVSPSIRANLITVVSRCSAASRIHGQRRFIPMTDKLRFATARTALGTVLVAAGDDGVRAVLMGASAADAERELRELHPGAFIRHDLELRELAARIVDSPQVDLDMRGTAFQLEVWR